MSTLEERIAKVMQKEIKCKTVLVEDSLVEETKKQYQKDNWEFVSETKCGTKTKLTYRIVK